MIWRDSDYKTEVTPDPPKVNTGRIAMSAKAKTAENEKDKEAEAS